MSYLAWQTITDLFLLISVLPNISADLDAWTRDIIMFSISDLVNFIVAVASFMFIPLCYNLRAAVLGSRRERRETYINKYRPLSNLQPIG